MDFALAGMLAGRNEDRIRWLHGDKNPYATQMMVQQSGQQGVPFSTIEYDDGTVDKILGFDRTRFEAVL